MQGQETTQGGIQVSSLSLGASERLSASGQPEPGVESSEPMTAPGAGRLIKFQHFHS